jgi:hypothetical protein
VLKSFIPSSYSGRLLLVASLVIAGAVYGLRLLATRMADPAIIFCVLTCLLPLPAVAFFLITVMHGFQAGGHPAPMIVLVLGLLLAIVLPTPPPYTEQRFFTSHRSEYAQLVELARNHNLEHSTRCVYDNLFEAPADYAKLSNDCLDVDYEPFFSVRFAPRSYDQIIVYSADPARIHEVYGYHHADSLIEKLDENWFYCSELAR